MIGASGTVREPGGDALVIALVGGAHYTSHLLQLALPPLFPILGVAFGSSFTELGLIVTLFYIASGLGQAGAGVLVDRWGATRLLIGGLALVSVATALAGLVSHYWMLLPLALAAGLGNSVFHPADLSILSHKVGAGRIGRAFSVHGVLGSLGYATAPVLVGTVAALASWRFALIAAGTIGLIATALVFSGRRALAYEQPASRVAGSVRGEEGPAYLAAIGSPVVLLAFFYFVITAFGGTGMQTFSVSALIAGYGLTLDAATLGLTLYLLGTAAGIVTGGFLADRTSRHDRVAMLGISVVAALALLIALMPPGFGGPIDALLFAAGMAGGITGPSRDILVRGAAIARGATGSVFGFVYSGFDLGSSVAPLLFGAVMDRHVPQGVFLVIAAAYLLGVPTVLRVRSRMPARVPKPAE
jgi:FSR family fosmidomycin resistance protein-like MFS transporter